MSYGHYGAPQRHSGYGAPPHPPHYGNQSYYQQTPRQPAAPPGADPQLWSYFTAVDADRSGAISATELQQALVNGA
jgi:hypothetical protein